ncbi:MAG: TolB family protein [Thermoleophilaceae bacterium]
MGRGTAALAAAIATVGLATPAAAASPTTSRVSLDALTGAQRNEPSWSPAISANGNLVAYQTLAPDYNGDRVPKTDVYLFDRAAQHTEWISVSWNGLPGNGSSFGPSLSGDGRFVAFSSDSNTLRPEDTGKNSAVFVRDRQTGALERMADPRVPKAPAWDASISGDDRYVAYTTEWSRASIDGHWRQDVLLHDRQTGETEVISPHGRTPVDSSQPSVSANGRFVAYVFGGGVYVRDRERGTTEAMSGGTGPSTSPAISASGRYVAFAAAGKRRVDSPYYELAGDVWVRDRQTGRLDLISAARGGARGNGVSGGPSISPDGRYVSFTSYADDLIANDTNDAADVFVRDRRTGTTRRVSISTARAQGNGESAAPFAQLQSSLSAGGRFVAFFSGASNLVPGDTNDAVDVFARGPLTP